MRVGGSSRLASALREALLPALCVACDDVLAGDDRGLCTTCRSRLVPMAGPCCPRCGVPSDSDVEPCLDCVGSAELVTGAVMWGEYDGVLRRAILALKHGGHDELARPLGRRLAARIAVTPWCRRVTVVAAVPSHALVRLRRGTGAADLLSREVASVLGRPLIPALRRHGLGRQAGRSRRQRTQLDRGVFTTRRRLEGQHVLLIDDVGTTGTTFRRASETLMEADAEAVYCAAMAHAPDPRRL